MKHQLALAAIVLSCATSAFAQRGNGNFNNGNNGNNRGGQNRNNSATLPLPQGVDRVVSIDAYNTLLVESKDDDNNAVYTPIVVQHVYSGGMAALFGGTSVPTEQFVSPASQNQNGRNGNQNGGNGNRNGNFGVSGLGGNQGGFNQGGNQGNFNQGGFNQGGNQGGFGFNQGGFNQGGGGFNQGGFFNGSASFVPNGTGFNNGFNATGNGQLFQTPNGNIGVSQTSVLGPNGQQVPLANGPFFVR